MTWKEFRDRALFVIGVVGLTVLLTVWVIQKRPPDPTLGLIFAGALGLPTVMRKDERD